LYTGKPAPVIPNIPYDSVPEGVGAEDNVVEKMGGMETELPKDALPHWERTLS